MGEPRSWGEFMEALVKLIGQAADTGGSQTAGTVFGKENAILGILKNGGMPMVKSIQKGVWNAGSNSYEISISAINPQKSIAFVDAVSYSEGSYVKNIYLNGLTETTLKIGSTYSGGSYAKPMVSWQVIEFY